MSETTGPNISPVLRYRDAAAALDFLEKAFGFRRVADYRGGDGLVVVVVAGDELPGAVGVDGEQSVSHGASSTAVCAVATGWVGVGRWAVDQRPGGMPRRSVRWSSRAAASRTAVICACSSR